MDRHATDEQGLELPSYLFAFVILLIVGDLVASHAERAEPLTLEARVKLESELGLALSEGRKDEAIDLYRAPARQACCLDHRDQRP